ncbi:hypothetical protein [Ferrovibrio sp.]|uniref:hypothetical protein n=2 Tax=Ferrovibrio sp. TaxID=1917215 RepID=UPI003510E116
MAPLRSLLPLAALPVIALPVIALLAAVAAAPAQATDARAADARTADARAADDTLPPVDPPGVWHRIGLTAETTTSTCIGNPVTPLCALDTWYACFLRDQPELCRLIEAGVVPPPLPQPRSVNEWREYRVVYARRPSALDPVDRSTEGPLKAQPGDILIGVMARVCYDSLQAPRCQTNIENDPPGVFMLRRQGDIWTNPYYFRPRF